MLSEEDKLEIRALVLQELSQVLGTVARGGSLVAGLNNVPEAKGVADAILRAIPQRAQDIQAEKDKLRGG